MKRLFSRDENYTRWFHYDEATDETTIETVQHLDPLVNLNHFAQKEQTKLHRWGDGKIVATIPLSIYLKLYSEGKTKDSAYMKRWLNDPENRMYRRFLGKV